MLQLEMASFEIGHPTSGFSQSSTQRSAETKSGTRRHESRGGLSCPVGRKIGQARVGDRELKLTIDKGAPSAFADFLVEQIPALFDAFSLALSGEGN